MKWKSTGIIQIDPRSRSTRVGQGWMILKTCPDLGDYYLRYLQHHLCIESPAWGPHISIIRGEPLRNIERWSDYSDLEISFEYDHYVQNNGKHWFLPVYCKELETIRLMFGLSKVPIYNFHLTIGVLNG